MNWHHVPGVKKPTLGLRVCYILPSILTWRKISKLKTHGQITKLSECLSIQIAQWLFLKKVLPLRLNLILCPGEFRQRPQLPCLCARKGLSLCLWPNAHLTGNEPLDVREIECNLPSMAHCSGGATLRFVFLKGSRIIFTIQMNVQSKHIIQCCAFKNRNSLNFRIMESGSLRYLFFLFHKPSTVCHRVCQRFIKDKFPNLKGFLSLRFATVFF